MRACHCTNQCAACGQCCRVRCTHRGGAYETWTVSPYMPAQPAKAPAAPIQPIEVGKTSKPPLTEEDVRRILREELQRAKDQER